MKVDGDVFLPPKDDSCTVILEGGAVSIGTWAKVEGKDLVPTFRQTPPCLVERGEINDAVTKHVGVFGSSLSGEVLIRRSALGVDYEGKTLFYGFAEAVTPKLLAVAMLSVGAMNVAQLDVNFNFPRFLFYAHPKAGGAPNVTAPLASPVTFRPTEYFGGPEQRDFFYLTKK